MYKHLSSIPRCDFPLVLSSEREDGPRNIGAIITYALYIQKITYLNFQRFMGAQTYFFL